MAETKNALPGGPGKAGRDVEALRKKAASLPRSPGVYIMKDGTGRIIYVGKSRSLRDRVSQYFHGSHDVKTAKMASSVYDFSFITCDTEMEAFAMENSLIKQHTPRYNIKLKDAKSYPYIKVNVKDEWPRITMTRTRRADGSLYFGPYSSTATVFSVISSLEKTFGIPSCKKKFPEDLGRGRPCVNLQIGRCLGVCSGKVTEDEYREAIDMAVAVLRGATHDVSAALRSDMERYSDALEFEKAAKCRDTLTALGKLNEKQKTVGPPDMECDVIGLCTADMTSAAHDSISVYRIRSGCITDSEHFLFDDAAITRAPGDGDPEDESPLASFVGGLYRGREVIPREILLSFELSAADASDLERFLAGQCGHKVTLKTPKRGASKYLCDMVVSDARSHTESRVSKKKASEKVLAELAKLLSLEVFPERIEAYDISNLGSEHITAGMIVAIGGRLAKSEYRTFSIRSTDGPDDYAAMTETLTRRLSHVGEEGSGMADEPDLILLDGGAGHVHVVTEALRGTEYERIPVFGMVKDDYHKTRTLVGPDGEVDISKQMNVFRFIYGLQEEVHRYTVGRMKKAKTRTLRTSSLEKIPGIGPAKAKKLLSYFKKLDNIKAATAEELLQAPGISEKDAGAVYAHFHGAENQK